MKSLTTIYQNQIRSSYKNGNTYNNPYITIEINPISFLIHPKELENIIHSAESIVNYYSNCTECSRDLENKMIVYQAKKLEIKMQLSFNQLLHLKDLLKGTAFKLSMDSILVQYKIS